MKIKIVEANREAIEAALAAVNGKAESFTISSFAQVRVVADALAQQFKDDGVTLREAAGAVARHRPAGPYANKYRYAAKSTIITVVVGANGKDFYLTGVQSSGVAPKQAELWDVRLKAESKAAWSRRVADKYGVLCEVVQ